MSRIVAIGRATALAGYALSGVDVVDAVDRERVGRAWDEAVAEEALVLLTAEARALLPKRLEAGKALWTVVPA